MDSRLTVLSCAVLVGIAGASQQSHAASDVDLTKVSRVEQMDDTDSTDAGDSSDRYVLRGNRLTPEAARALRASVSASRSRAAHEKHLTCKWGNASSGSTAIAGVQGIVLDVAGNPVPSVTVHVAGRGRTLTATTNTDGQYRLLVDAGDYRVWIEPASFSLGPGHPSVAPRAVRLSGSPSRVDFVVPRRPSRIAGSSTVR